MMKNRAHEDLWNFFFAKIHMIKKILNPCEKGLKVTRHELIKEPKKKTAGME